MTCDDARESLSALLDEALTPDERRAVGAHLEGCAECRGELERLRRTVALLQRVAPAHAPAGFVDRVVAATRPRPWYRRAVAAVFLPLSAKLPVEAAALVMVALLSVYIFDQTPALQQAARQEASAPSPGRPETATGLVEERKDVVPVPAPEAAAPGPTAPRAEDQGRDATVARETAAPPASAPPASPARPAPAVPSVATPAETPAPATAPPPTPMPPPAAKAESSGERAAGAPRPDAENRQQALERAAGSTPAAPSLAAKRAQPSGDVVSRLFAKDRDAAERDLAQLIARVGGRETQRRREDDATIVEALIPQPRYGEFTAGLASIGVWRVEAERPDLPSQVHVILRVE